VIELQGKLGGETPSTVSLEALAAQSGMILPLGYSQVLFAPSSILRKDSARIALQKFLEVTVEGWKASDRDANDAVSAVMESRKVMGYPEEQQDILDENSAEFQRLSLARCLPYVATGSSQCHRIDPKKWQEASTAMSALGLVSYNIPASLSLDTTIFPSEDNTIPLGVVSSCDIVDGLSLARKIRSDVAKRSLAFTARTGRSPCLAVISFGVASDEERMESFSTPEDSWWTKHHVCEQAGITYKSVVLISTATAEDLQSAIFKLNNDSSVDAILMERCQGGNITSSISASINQIGSLIVGEKDVDGENPRSLPGARGGDINNASLGSFMVLKDEAYLSDNSPRMLPCAVAGILELLDHYKHSDNIPGGNIVVVGRSKKLGLPLSLELMQRNATVTTCHSLTPPEDLKRLCKGADYLFVAAGQPHLVTKDMVKQGAVVINIGTTYIKKVK
jgi:methylenetetrahydrofolate dehydrogenase (NADP+)/methenyltetrahydrofolate cyclohydrolase